MKKWIWRGCLASVYLSLLLLGTLAVHGRSFQEWVQWLVPPGLIRTVLMFPLQHHHPVTFAKLLNIFDRMVNILLFLPIGAGIFLAFHRLFTYSVRCLLILALFFGCALSLGIEWYQARVPNRVPSASDVVANSAGAVFGCYLLCYRELLREHQNQEHDALTSEDD